MDKEGNLITRDGKYDMETKGMEAYDYWLSIKNDTQWARSLEREHDKIIKSNRGDCEFQRRENRVAISYYPLILRRLILQQRKGCHFRFPLPLDRLGEDVRSIGSEKNKSGPIPSQLAMKGPRVILVPRVWVLGAQKKVMPYENCRRRQGSEAWRVLEYWHEDAKQAYGERSSE